VINKVFSPTPEELERAQKMIEAFRIAEAAGHGAIRFEGMMVDYANCPASGTDPCPRIPGNAVGENGSAG